MIYLFSLIVVNPSMLLSEFWYDSVLPRMFG
jgi:hypothetical protein